jgi:PAS domain S-box-containing protein
MSNIASVLRLSIIVYVVEVAIMLAFSIVPTGMQLWLDQYPWFIIVLNTIILTLVSSPLIYLWIIRPFVSARSKAELLQSVEEREQYHGYIFDQLPQGLILEDYSAVKKIVDQLLSEGIEDLKTYLVNQPGLLRQLVAKIRVIDANQALLELFECSSLQQFKDGEVDSSSWWNDDWTEFYASEITNFTGQKKWHKAETSDNRADGLEFQTRIISTVVKGDEDTWKRVLTIHEDITVQHKREELLLGNQITLEKLVKERTSNLETALNATEQSEAFLEACTEIAHLGYAIWDNDLDRDIIVSKELATIHGLTVDEYLHTVNGTEKYLEFVVPHDREKYMDYENSNFAEQDEKRESIEYRITRTDGEIRYLKQYSQPLHPKPDKKDQDIVVIQDITELKQAEIRLKESEALRVQAAEIANKVRGEQERERKAATAQIIQTSKLATLGEMATAIAHELNQPLNIIRMATSNSRRQIAEGTVDAKYLNEKLERIEGQSIRAASIIDHMRMFGREAKEQPQLIDPRKVVSNALDLVGEQLRLAGIKVVTELAQDCPSILGHTIQLEQVLLNVLTNARDAMAASDGESKITLRVFEEDDGLRITCEDTGEGIPEDALPRIFEPFYTTKDMGKGTGLGLSVSYGIIRDMNGTIAGENNNDGAKFTIILPAVTR